MTRLHFPKSPVGPHGTRTSQALVFVLFLTWSCTGKLEPVDHQDFSPDLAYVTWDWDAEQSYLMLSDIKHEEIDTIYISGQRFHGWQVLQNKYIMLWWGVDLTVVDMTGEIILQFTSPGFSDSENLLAWVQYLDRGQEIRIFDFNDGSTVILDQPTNLDAISIGNLLISRKDNLILYNVFFNLIGYSNLSGDYLGLFAQEQEAAYPAFLNTANAVLYHSFKEEATFRHNFDDGTDFLVSELSSLPIFAISDDDKFAVVESSSIAESGSTMEPAYMINLKDGSAEIIDDHIGSVIFISNEAQIIYTKRRGLFSWSTGNPDPVIIESGDLERRVYRFSYSSETDQIAYSINDTIWISDISGQNKRMYGLGFDPLWIQSD